MPQATVVGHGKKLIMGKIKDKKVLCWSGKLNFQIISKQEECMDIKGTHHLKSAS